MRVLPGTLARLHTYCGTALPVLTCFAFPVFMQIELDGNRRVWFGAL